MRVYVFMCACTYAYICTRIYIYMCVNMYLFFVWKNVYICMNACGCMFFMRVYCMCVYMCVYVCVCYVYTYNVFV